MGIQIETGGPKFIEKGPDWSSRVPDDYIPNPIIGIWEQLLDWMADTTKICSHWEDLPRTPGVYFVVSRETGSVVYVGQAFDLFDRWKTHRLRYLFDDNAHVIRWKSFDSEHFSSPEHEEAAFIVFLTPKHNQMAKCNLAGVAAAKMATT